jgi:endonuclease YncB( thermonuclease family)
MIRLLLMLILVCGTARATEGRISGQGKAIDSTIIQVNDQRIMLFGVDSVMRKQGCMLDGKPWLCWPVVVQDLQSLLDQGPVSCDIVGDADVYGRLIGRCSVNGQSINEQLVAHGFAVARVSESSDYVAAEAAAKEKKIGLWRGAFVPPSTFRRSAGIAVERP